MEKLKCGVIGVGYLGKFHAQKYTGHPDAELVAVADADQQTVNEVASQNNCNAILDYRDLLGEVDAVSIVVPTSLHHEVTKACLERGIHVLVEKPITTTVEQAIDLIETAKKYQCTLQVGHLERFNPAVMNVTNHLDRPLFIESTRLAPFKMRAIDVDVVLDLMIHDIDIILDLVRSDPKMVSASGASILSSGIDIANARLEFENGCVANVTSSRVSMKAERKMRLFQASSYLSIDFQSKSLKIHKRGEKEMFPGIPEIMTEEAVFDEGDALALEIDSFIKAITNQTPPKVTGEDGRRALETAIKITQLVRATSAFKETETHF
jgi:predicted dehydrogenase